MSDPHQPYLPPEAKVEHELCAACPAGKSIWKQLNSRCPECPHLRRGVGGCELFLILMILGVLFVLLYPAYQMAKYP